MSEPQPGVMHPIDKAFYDLAVKERDYERVRFDRVEAERDALAARVEELEARIARAVDVIGRVPNYATRGEALRILRGEDDTSSTERTE